MNWRIWLPHVVSTLPLSRNPILVKRQLLSASTTCFSKIPLAKPPPAPSPDSANCLARISSSASLFALSIMSFSSWLSGFVSTMSVSAMKKNKQSWNGHDCAKISISPPDEIPLLFSVSSSAAVSTFGGKPHLISIGGWICVSCSIFVFSCCIFVSSFKSLKFRVYSDFKLFAVLSTYLMICWPPVFVFIFSDIPIFKLFKYWLQVLLNILFPRLKSFTEKAHLNFPRSLNLRRAAFALFQKTSRYITSF